MKRALFALIAAAACAPVLADQALATAKNCMTCHAIDKKVVGPAYKDVAAKYAGDKGAVDKLAAKIMKGGSGVWGPVPMPANTQVNEAEAKKLAAWVLSLKVRAAAAPGDVPGKAGPRSPNRKSPRSRAFSMAPKTTASRPAAPGSPGSPGSRCPA